MKLTTVSSTLNSSHLAFHFAGLVFNLCTCIFSHKLMSSLEDINLMQNFEVHNSVKDRLITVNARTTLIKSLIQVNTALTCHICIGPRKPINSSSTRLYFDVIQKMMPLPFRFFCTLSSERRKPQLETCKTASSTNGFTFPCRTDSATSLNQNSANLSSSIKSLS